ncbi:hypothetical protein ACFQX4_20665, partial [Roseomonas sp. GCM10028921]
ESSSSCQAASLLLVLSRTRDASVIRQQGQNHSGFNRGNRHPHDVGNRKTRRMGTVRAQGDFSVALVDETVHLLPSRVLT